MNQRSRLAQIDLIKGAAILAVLALHGLTPRQLTDGWAVLHVGQAVPVFFVVMGMNAAASLRRRGTTSVRELYGGGYLAGRAERLLLPFAVVWVIALVAGAIDGGLHFGPLMLAGVLPLAGPGNYFVTIAFEFALVFPALYALFVRAPRATLVGCFAAAAAFELAAPHVGFLTDAYAYDASILRYLAQIGLGVWIALAAGGGRGRTGWIVALAPLSVAYLIALHESPSSFDWLQPGFGISTNFLSAFYAAALVIAGLRLFPARVERAPGVVLAELGKASWHIFLVQVVWFVLDRHRGYDFLPLHVVVTCAVGYALYRAMDWATAAVRARGGVSGNPAPVGSGRSGG
ncbi:MAG TPA: acyltransferase [Thermoleophilaceae bacterium]|nr:acyltransferase [Thermoleophilaceae bacterium]